MFHPFMLLGGLTLAGIAVTVMLSVVNDYKSMSGRIENQKAEIQKLESRSEARHRMVERRDEAIAEVGGACAEKIRFFMKNGVPVKTKPFDQTTGQ